MDRVFDTTLAQLVVHFMRGPVAGMTVMGRVSRTGGVVAACEGDHGGGEEPPSSVWDAVRELNPEAEDESPLAGRARVIWPSFSERPDCTRSKRPPYGLAFSTPPSRTGGTR